MRSIDYKKTVLKDKKLIPKEKEVVYEVYNTCKIYETEKNGKTINQIETIKINDYNDFKSKRKVVV